MCARGQKSLKHWKSQLWGTAFIYMFTFWLSEWMTEWLDGRKGGGLTRQLGLIMLTSLLIFKTNICSLVQANKRVVLSFK